MAAASDAGEVQWSFTPPARSNPFKSAAAAAAVQSDLIVGQIRRQHGGLAFVFLRLKKSPVGPIHPNTHTHSGCNTIMRR